MAVFRIEKTRDYTVMSNHHLRNAGLSLKSKGLLSMMLSLPENWNYTTRGLAKICKEGTDSITIDGKQFPNDRIAILKEIGSFIEAPSFYANLTGRENLDIICRILGLPKADVEDALELVELAEFGDRLAKKYSLGMKQRLGLAGALLGRPPILILDEPTNGLDPSGIHEIRNLVKSLPSLYDCTVLISSHMLSEIELIADDIGILNHGRLLFEGSMNDLRQYALQSGFAADNLEDVFLSMVEKDNMDRKQRAKL